ncbi:hypothetical protein LTR56_025266 [Elasticomyces elasticus]|nr:hypothetical protein LTR56_025266 [Elasticomyces elasticus]KAK4903804.1 hypothetical protein LTR49_026630 [Elasticomyces elasticus]KAK5733221.1 hypothetical protein LTS12_026983 [Elasticomyces elasticus]
MTGFSKAEHKSFVKLQDAKDYMHTKGIIDYAQDMESENENTTPERGDAAFYAVAHGKAPGVYRYYEEGARPLVDKHPHACHKHFRTQQQAEIFILDWTEEYLYINNQNWIREFAKGLVAPVLSGLAEVTGIIAGMTLIDDYN